MVGAQAAWTPSRERGTHGVGTVSLHQLIDGDIVLVQFRARVVPADDSFSS